MRIEATRIAGVHTVELEPTYDERGFVTRTYDRESFRRLGLEAEVARTSLSYNRLLGTLRGLYWRLPPSGEAKLVRVARGRAYQVVVDLRFESSTFGSWVGVELSGSNGLGVFIPERCAHGFLTLEDDTELTCQSSGAPDEGELQTLRWDDPDLAIEWPIAPRVISRRDARTPNRFADLLVARVA